MKRLFNLLLAIVALLLAAALLVSYFSSFAEPDKLHGAALIWFAMPYLWVANALMLVVLFFFRRWLTCLVPLVALVCTWGGMSTIVSFGPAPEAQGKELRVATFNIRYLERADAQQYIDFFHNLDADVVCLQEMAVPYQWKNKGIKQLAELFADYPYIIDRTRSGLSASGVPYLSQMIVSRYPIEKFEPCPEQPLPFVLAAKIKVDEQTTFEIFNVHLQSIHLLSQHIDAVNNAPLHPLAQETKSTLWQTAKLIVKAFDRRTLQARRLAACLSERTVPVIVCGDFNDTPISFAYHTLTQNLTDAFCCAKGGFSNTYNGDLPPLRIDYILHSSHFTATHYREHRLNLSDHLPVSCELSY